MWFWFFIPAQMKSWLIIIHGRQIVLELLGTSVAIVHFLNDFPQLAPRDGDARSSNQVSSTSAALNDHDDMEDDDDIRTSDDE